MKKLLNRFFKDRQGSIGLLFALTFVPIIIIAGMTMDYARAATFRTKLSAALDAATLALGKNPPMSEADASIFLHTYIDGILGPHVQGQWSISAVQDQGSTVQTSAAGTVKTTFMALANIFVMPVSTFTEVIRERKKMEIALVLDNTGSMNGGGKIGALRDAATSLVNIIYSDQQAAAVVKVALVPFVTAVNLKSTGVYNTSWVDTNGLATNHGTNFDESGGPVNHLALFDQIPNTVWKGCVEARPAPYDTDDTPPSSANPDTLWVPYFWPDEPDDGSGDYHNKYLVDNASGTQAEKQKSTTKYNGTAGSIDETAPSTYGPNKACGQPIIPLTNNTVLLNDEIAAMRGWNGSGTNIAQGMAWGWRVLSPTEPFTEGAPYTDVDTLKVMIVLTDGENLIWGGWNSHNNSNYTSYGYLTADRLGTQDKNVAKGVVNTKVQALCNKIKAQNIRLYTITFQLNSSALQSLFRNCATTPTLYYASPSNSDLQTVFEKIGYDLSNLRLSK